MNSFQIVHCATAIIFIIIQLTECYSRNAENHVQFILSETKNVQFVNKLRQPDVTVKPYNDVINLWNLDNPLDVLAEKDGSSQEKSPNPKYFKIESNNNGRIPRQINNGYSSIYPSLPTYNPNAYNMYSTPYKTPGPQYNGFSSPPTNPYNYPSNVYPPNYNRFPQNSTFQASVPSFNYSSRPSYYPSNVYPSNYNRFPQNSTFQASVPSFNYSSRPSYYPQGQNILPNSSTKPTYIPNNGYNQPSGQNSNRYNHYNNSHNYSLNSNITNFNPGYPQPNYNPFFGLAGRTNNSNIYNTPNAYNFNTRNNPVYDSSQPFRSSNFSNPSYPTYGPSAVNANFRSNNSLNNPQNPAYNPYFTPNTPISNQTYSVNPSYYNSSYYNYRNPQAYNQNNYYNNPQNNSYFNSYKNRFNNTFGGPTISRPYQNNATTFPPNNVYNYNTHINQPSYTQTTPWSTPYSRPNTRSPNNFGGPNQNNWTEPNHFFYTPGRNNFNGSMNYNFPPKYYK